MDDLLEVIALMASTLHRDRIEVIANAAERFDSPAKFDHWLTTFVSGVTSDSLSRLSRAWIATPTVSGREIAFGLRTAVLTATTIGSVESINLVWTGPKTGLIPTRNTEQAIKEVIDGASRSLFIVSYVFYRASSIVDSLNEAAERDVAVRILLESAEVDGGTISGNGLEAMHQAVPQAALYIWGQESKKQNSGGLSASVHAKCAVADRRIAFVTSANLTSAAMERNMELGVLIRGGSIPQRLQSHLEALTLTRNIVSWR
jgi:cardiolipin synthase